MQIRILNKLTKHISAECEFEPRQYFRPILCVPFDGWPSLCALLQHTFVGMRRAECETVLCLTTTKKMPPIGVLDMRLLVSSSSALICAHVLVSCSTIAAYVLHDFYFFPFCCQRSCFFFVPFSGSAWFFIRAQITIGRLDVCRFVR